MTLYKSLTEDNKGPYSEFDFTPYLPKNGKPGKWLPKVETLSICKSGWHGCEDGDILEYLNAQIFEIETRGEILKDGDNVKLGTLTMEVMHTPGHTPGSISIALGDVVFTGDTLFAGGVGRTDFEYGSEDDLFKSIHDKLMPLADDTIIYPGHGPESTIGEERDSNPFIS